MTKQQAIRWFGKMVLGENITIARDKYSTNNFGMDISGSTPRIKISNRLDTFRPDYADKAFRADFVERCPSAQGFSHITLTLLHECGHWATRSVMDIVEYCKRADNAYTQQLYMAIPWEHLATDWAICWLSSPCNRKIAKEFEKYYFGH